jgi:hypothetical protein
LYHFVSLAQHVRGAFLPSASGSQLYLPSVFLYYPVRSVYHTAHVAKPFAGPLFSPREGLTNKQNRDMQLGDWGGYMQLQKTRYKQKAGLVVIIPWAALLQQLCAFACLLYMPVSPCTFVHACFLQPL